LDTAAAGSRSDTAKAGTGDDARAATGPVRQRDIAADPRTATGLAWQRDIAADAGSVTRAQDAAGRGTNAAGDVPAAAARPDAWEAAAAGAVDPGVAPDSRTLNRRRGRAAAAGDPR
jgi:hypothetical protein